MGTGLSRTDTRFQQGEPTRVRGRRLTFFYNTNSRLAAQYTEIVSQRNAPVETRKPTHASTNSSCEFATNMARDTTMLAKERTVTHKKSEKALEEVGSSPVGEGSAKYSFQRSKRNANATNAMPHIVPIVPIIADRSVVSFGVSSVSPSQPLGSQGKCRRT